MVSSDEMNLYKIQKYVKDFDPINYNFLLLIWATALKAYYFATTYCRMVFYLRSLVFEMTKIFRMRKVAIAKIEPLIPRIYYGSINPTTDFFIKLFNLQDRCIF